MFLGHNASWWGIAIGVFALVLSIPLTIIGNFMTPMLAKAALRWTDRSLDKRIAKLETRLRELDDSCPLMTPTEEQLVKAALCNAKLLSFTMSVLGITAFLIAFNFPLLVAVRYLLCAIGAGLYLMPLAWRKNAIVELDQYLKDHSPKWRKAYRKSIESYKKVRNRTP